MSSKPAFPHLLEDLKMRGYRVAFTTSMVDTSSPGGDILIAAGEGLITQVYLAKVASPGLVEIAHMQCSPVGRDTDAEFDYYAEGYAAIRSEDGWLPTPLIRR